MLSKVAHRAKIGDPAADPVVQLDAKQDFTRRFQDAVTLRQKGQRVAL